MASQVHALKVAPTWMVFIAFLVKKGLRWLEVQR